MICCKQFVRVSQTSEEIQCGGRGSVGMREQADVAFEQIGRIGRGDGDRR